jgi:hypothetical protein
MPDLWEALPFSKGPTAAYEITPEVRNSLQLALAMYSRLLLGGQRSSALHEQWEAAQDHVLAVLCAIFYYISAPGSRW